MLLERLLLHRVWTPLLVATTIGIVGATLVLRAAPASPIFAGCHAPEVGPQTAASPDGVFRWTKRTAAVRLSVHGPVLVVPVYLARPDLADGPIDVDVTIHGLHADAVRLTSNGWHVLRYDLADLAGQSKWQRLDSITVTFETSRTIRPSDVSESADHRELGIGLGQPRWSARVPPDDHTRTARE